MWGMRWGKGEGCGRDEEWVGIRECPEFTGRRDRRFLGGTTFFFGSCLGWPEFFFTPC